MSAEPGKDMLDATFIEVGSGVSLFTHEPFCTIIVDGRQAGQMSPAEVRAMALAWLEAAEAAESDALVYAVMTDPEGIAGTEEHAAVFVGEMRRRRAQP